MGLRDQHDAGPERRDPGGIVRRSGEDASPARIPSGPPLEPRAEPDDGDALGKPDAVRAAAAAAGGSSADALAPGRMVGPWWEKALKAPMIAALRVWHSAIAPALPPMCRFHPSCSVYAVGCLRAHRLAPALGLIARRVAKCQPFHPGGIDPVPETAERRRPAAGG